MGNGTIISYSDSLIARQAGLYVSNPAASGLHNGRKIPLPNSPKNMVEMFEKVLMQKMVEKMAEKTVNTTLEPRTQPSYNNNIMSTENWLNYFFKNIEHLFGIEGHICLGCLMIQPVKLSYSEGENSGGCSTSIPLPCFPLPEYVSEPAIRKYQSYITQNGFASQLKRWVDLILPNTKHKKIAAIRVPDPGPRNAIFAVRLAADKSESDPKRKKYVSLRYCRERCYELLLPTDTNPNHWSIRVIENGVTSLMDEDEVIDYLSITKNSTYGFFRTKIQNAYLKSPQIPGECIYLIMLVFNNQTHTVSNVYDIK